jgi:4-oxalocrotonate tautomerase
MPVITIEASTLSHDVKERLAKELTDAASEITDIPKEAFVVIVKENAFENMAQGGVLLSKRLKDR